MLLWERQAELTKKHPVNNGESYYDLFDDLELIESSFLKQYGIRLRTEDDMSWSEFCSLLSGIMHDTPLGQIVCIRAEKDPNVIKSFTNEQKRIRNDWIKHCARKSKEIGKSAVDWGAFQDWARSAFS